MVTRVQAPVPKVVVGLLGAAVVAAIGALAQARATRRDAQRYPPPGVLVDVGGHRLHLNVQGDGPGPTVVLEAGMGSFSSKATDGTTSCNWGSREVGNLTPFGCNISQAGG